MAENLNLEPEYVKKISARLASLQAVLQDLCVQHGFDHSAALTLAGVPKQGTTDDARDSNYYQNWLNNLNDCLPRKWLAPIYNAGISKAKNVVLPMNAYMINIMC